MCCRENESRRQNEPPHRFLTSFLFSLEFAFSFYAFSLLMNSLKMLVYKCVRQIGGTVTTPEIPCALVRPSYKLSQQPKSQDKIEF